MTTKPSKTLRYLESHEVFTLEEYATAVDPSVCGRTRYGNLQNAVARGQAYRVKRGLYASDLGVYRERVPNVYLVAAKAAEDAVLTHHSALELHGVAHTPLRTVYFTSTAAVGDFGVRGYRFHRVPPPPAPGSPASLQEFVTRLRSGETTVPATTSERTLVDCLRDLRLAGGIEEMLRSLGGFTSVSADRVADYARLLASPTLTARAGWVLDMFAERWRVDPSALDQMRASLGRGTYRLVPASDRNRQRFVAPWRLYVPADLPYQEWTRE